MTVEITSRDTMEPTLAEGDLVAVVNKLNLASAEGKKFIIVTEEQGPYPGCDTALEITNIVRVRSVGDGESAFVS